MVYYVVPARRGSKGLPFKNRTLVRVLLPKIPPDARARTIVTTDDEDIKAWALGLGVRVVDRPSELAQDQVAIWPVMEHAVRTAGLADGDVVVMLYPTYPQRSWADVERALAFFEEQGAPSMCCRKRVATHPYLAYVALPGSRGRRVIDHQLYRRQDYPECFELSHFVCAFRVGMLPILDNQMLCADSVYFPIDDVIDVDTPADLWAWRREVEQGEREEVSS